MFAYLLPYFISLMISLGIAVYAWRRREVESAAVFAILCLSEAFWTFGYIYELTSHTLAGKIFWDNWQFVAMFFATGSWFYFALKFSGRLPAKPKLFLIGLGLLPFIATLVIYTDQFHRGFRPNALLVPGEPFSALTYDYSPFIWVTFVYAYALGLGGIGVLIVKSFRDKGLYQIQSILILCGLVAPMVGGALTMANITLSYQRDTAPLTFAIGNLFITWGLFRFQIFDIVPIARDLLVENMTSSLIVLDMKNRVVDINPVALNLISKSYEEVIGQPATIVFAQFPDMLVRFGDVREIKTELFAILNDAPQYFEVDITPIYHKNQTFAGRMIQVRNISERKQMEQTLKERTRELEIANQELEAFSYSVSHDLRAPLRAVEGFSTILLGEVEGINPDAQHYISRIKSASAQMKELIDGLLALAHVSRAQIQKTEVDLSRIAQEIIVDLQQTDPNRKVDWSVHLGLYTEGDARLLRAVLENFLSNAWKFTRHQLTAKIEFGMNQVSNQEIYFVRDNGAGFDQTYADKLFAPFQRLHRSDEFEGTGIGLATVQRIIHRHGGQVWAEGHVGQGATFYFTLAG
ncbi:MAG TPA: histidine kinase N-terminal 7TM domain-containing protein [Anaerolineales bacterium]|nr:histidine kinase N-terminal 7TM domain-containing protein [Anaerolineales bacterium]